VVFTINTTVHSAIRFQDLAHCMLPLDHYESSSSLIGTPTLISIVPVMTYFALCCSECDAISFIRIYIKHYVPPHFCLADRHCGKRNKTSSKVQTAIIGLSAASDLDCCQRNLNW